MSHLTWFAFSAREGKKEIPFVGPSTQGPTELAPNLKSWPLARHRVNSEDGVSDYSHTWNIKVFNQEGIALNPYDHVFLLYELRRGRETFC